MATTKLDPDEQTKDIDIMKYAPGALKEEKSSAHMNDRCPVCASLIVEVNRENPAIVVYGTLRCINSHEYCILCSEKYFKTNFKDPKCGVCDENVSHLRRHEITRPWDGTEPDIPIADTEMTNEAKDRGRKSVWGVEVIDNVDSKHLVLHPLQLPTTEHSTGSLQPLLVPKHEHYKKVAMIRFENVNVREDYDTRSTHLLVNHESEEMEFSATLVTDAVGKLEGREEKVRIGIQIYTPTDLESNSAFQQINHCIEETDWREVIVYLCLRRWNTITRAYAYRATLPVYGITNIIEAPTVKMWLETREFCRCLLLDPEPESN
jgi:hypothetical protein